LPPLRQLPHHAAALAILGLPYAVPRASIRACPIPELISALPQSFENGRHSTMSALVSASLGARPYMIGEGGTLDECVQQFMHLPEAQRHLYEIHTAPQSDLVGAILSTDPRRRAGAAQGFSRKIVAAHLAGIVADRQQSF
jgi:hypothetical protein